MRLKQARFGQSLPPLAKRLLVGALCLAMVAPQQYAFASGPSSKAKLSTKPAPARQIQGDERIIHALNRFTFGPRPGDLESVKKLGLDRWFEEQLHPEKLDQTVLNEQLANYPSVEKLSTIQLMERFPNERMIREASTDKSKLPQNGIERAIYNDQIQRVIDQKKKDMEANKLNVEQNKREVAARQQRDTAAQDSAPSSANITTVSLNATDQKAEQEQRAKSERLFLEFMGLYPKERVRRLMIMGASEYDSFQRYLNDNQRRLLLDGLNPEQREIVSALYKGMHNLVPDEMMDQRVVRDLYSNAQLQEVMTDFWLNHFNVYLRKNEEMPYYLATFERDVIRPRALGKFEDLLEATAHSPAMMLYLDNSSSIGPNSIAAIKNQGKNKKASEGLNENYARELMELHTVGVNGGYTQADVTNVARILTGWGVDKPGQGGDFIFNDRRHEPGSKIVMGRTFNEDGENEGRALIHMLATRPETAQFISRKLALRFVSDDPPQSLVDRMAKTFLNSNGDISAVMRAMFRSPEFWNTENYRAKVKTPLEFVISAVRASGISPKTPRPVVNAIRDMGMPLYNAIPPTGYTSKSNLWLTSSALVGRMNFALALTSNHLPDCNKNWAGSIDPWLAQSPISVVPAKEEERLEAELLGVSISPATSAAILRQIAPMPAPAPGKSASAAQPTTIPAPAEPLTPAEADFYNTPQQIVADQWEQKDELMAGLLMSSPEFQRR